MKFTILIIDDEKNIREGLKAALEDENSRIFLAKDGAEGLARIAKGDIDLVITDLRMPDVTGEQVLERCKKESPDLPVIILTGHGTIDNAVAAMQAGAYDFLTKPIDLERLGLVVRNALRTRKVEIERQRLQEDLSRASSFGKIIGRTAAMARLFDMISRAADSKASVLITGESGVGKELVADALHSLSARKSGPLIKVHCAALSESLLESELFGHEKGAFTGALAMKRGRFELANGGTIFLDEIGEINQTVQIKLLRVLQEKRFERIGGEDTLEVDARIVAATNRNLEEEVAAGRFREDLYYRLNVVRLQVPPLRERRDDIPLLAAHFLQKFAGENGKKITSFDSQTRSILYNCDWPGNIRQLQNCIESAVVMCAGDKICASDLPPSVAQGESGGQIQIPAGSTLDDAEKIIIEKTLAAQNWNKTRAAEILKISRKTMQRKIKQFGIKG